MKVVGRTNVGSCNTITKKGRERKRVLERKRKGSEERREEQLYKKRKEKTNDKKTRLIRKKGEETWEIKGKRGL